MPSGPPDPSRVSRIRAGLEVAGRTLRYAEVDLGPRPRLEDVSEGLLPGPRLLRLGTCDFDFEVADALTGSGSPAHLRTLTTALRQIFHDSEATQLALAFHAWHATSFFTPLPEGLSAHDRLEQLRQEAAMLGDVRLGPTLRVAATPVRLERLADGSRVLWHHVMSLPEAVRARLQALAEALGERVQPVPVESAAAAAATLRHLVHAQATESPAPDPYLLSMGLYGTRVEVAVCRGETWLFGHWADVPDDADGPYFVAALLDRLGIAREGIARLYVYGDAERAGLVRGVEQITGARARVLNPIKLFRLTRSEADPRSLAAYVPALGAALH